MLNKFDNISNILINNKNKLNKDQIYKLYKLQEYLCLAINQIFNKIIRNINIELCCKLYNSIINSFLNRSPYEEGMLCLLNLIILLFVIGASLIFLNVTGGQLGLSSEVQHPSHSFC